ncbi:MAG TPA: NADP-dependent malic enzyme [Candidatus Levybacteria bacterium]|nr:NADP-dependent malic enzyme [Candidatus Levybacteria bacterium]
MSDVYEESVLLHKKYQGKIKIESVVPLNSREDLSLLYTPGVAQPSREIAKDPALSFDLTWRGRVVAVISDGSSVLGLGNIGPEAALPVMEGKALLLKQFGGVDSVPIVVNTQDPSEIVTFIKNIAPSFAGINLEDIAAPHCFQIEESLQDIGIPVFHDDQHGTAIVIAAALQNAAKVVNKPYDSLKVVIVGAGAAGLATSRILLGLNCSADVCYRIQGQSAVDDVIVVDKTGALYSGRDNQNIYKQAIAGISNKDKKTGNLSEVIKGADVVIGVSGPGSITADMVKSMASDPIVFALANPVPEIMPDEALQAGAAIVASGRSDFPNQINNVLAFPGIFRAVIDGRLKQITQEMKIAAADALSAMVENPTKENIIPDVFSPNLAENLSKAILKTAV